MIKDGYRDATRRITTLTSLNDSQPVGLVPGDLAITANGIHMLVFLGDNDWVEADPTFGKVVRLTTPQPDNPWFTDPIVIVRWRLLESEGP